MPLEHDLFRRNVERGLRVSVEALRSYGLRVPIKSRDKREPHRRQKLQFERDIQKVIYDRFQAQARALRRAWIEQTKAITPDLPPLDDDDEYIAELMTILIQAARDGVVQFSEDVIIGIDYTLVNTRAANWARQYAGELIRGIDDTTLAAVQSAVAQYIETPGFTIGQLVDLLPFDDIRAARISVTEVTRSYSQGQQLAGDELRAEFPGVQVIDTWFTNEDDKVCDLCGELDGIEVEHGETFYPPDDYGDGYAPRHVNCRCWHSSSTRIE